MERIANKSNPLTSLAWAEMRVIFANLLWHFNLEGLSPQSANWIEEQKIHMLWEKKDLDIRIRKRY